MPTPVVPAGAVPSLKRFLDLLDDQVQEVLKYRWGLFGAPQLTMLQLADRLGLSIGEVKRLERSGLDDLKRLFGNDSKWL